MAELRMPHLQVLNTFNFRYESDEVVLSYGLSGGTSVEDRLSDDLEIQSWSDYLSQSDAAEEASK